MNFCIVFLIIDLKKLIKYEKQKTLVEEKRKFNDDLNKKIYLLEDKQDIPPNNNCKSVCCNKKKNEVFERLSRPNLKIKICSKATSAIGIQTDLQNKKTSKMENVFIYIFNTYTIIICFINILYYLILYSYRLIPIV